MKRYRISISRAFRQVAEVTLEADCEAEADFYASGLDPSEIAWTNEFDISCPEDIDIDQIEEIEDLGQE